MKGRLRLAPLAVALALIATLLAPQLVAAQATDLSGTWSWTDCSNQTNCYTGPATIVHNVSGGAFTWHWDGAGPDSSSDVTGNGTVSGTQLSIATDPYVSSTNGETYTGQFEGTIVSADELQGTWTQSDGQDGTFTATRTTEKGRIISVAVPLSDRAAAARSAAQAQVDDLVAQRKALDQELAAAIASAKKERDEHRGFLTNLEVIQGQLRDLRQGASNGFNGSERDRFKELKGFLREAWIAELASRARMQNKEHEARVLLEKRDSLSGRLLKIVQPIEALDFELLGIKVTSKAKTVHDVNLRSSFARIKKLTEEIDGLQEELLKLAVHRKELLKSFQEAHSIATNRLVAIADLISRNGYIKLGADAATIAVDLGFAAAKGGLAGVFVDLSVKLLEAYKKDNLSKFSGNPIPSQEKVDAWFKQGTLQAVGNVAEEVGVARTVKQTAGKVTKDFAAEQLTTWFPELGKNAFTGEVVKDAVDPVKRARGMLERIQDLKPKLNGERFADGFKSWGALGGLGRGLMQDIAKAALKKHLEGQEFAEWQDYLKLEAKDHLLYSLWHACAEAYWDTYDQIEASEKEKAELMAGFDPNNGHTTRTDVAFNLPTTLVITLEVPRSTLPFATVPIKVLVGGIEATRVSAKVFEVATSALPPSQLGSLGIEVK